MILALALLIATVTETPPDVVRVKARPELPWVTAVFAPKSATVDEKRIKADAPALSDIGVRIRMEKLDGFDVVVVEGPPEAHDAIVKAARSAGGASGGVLFVDGRTTLVERGALPTRTPPARTGQTTKRAQPLSPSPGLVDVEGAALALFVDGRIENGALIIDKPDRAALDALVSAPLTQRRVDELRIKARARVAERRAKAGGWARDMALMWLAYGTLDVEEPNDLGSALRARVFPSVLVR